MVKGKLILICQSGGEFLTKDDGLLSYEGGEANAITINPETLFDDLMLKLAELLNFDHKSLSVKYFLPGNKRTLITLSNDKDLKRMYDFHGDAVTAEVFVTGKVGFDREAFTTPGGRANGIKLAETVPAYTVSQAAGTTSVSTPAEDSDTDEPSDADCTPHSPVSGNADGTPDSPIAFDMSGTPADTVKKRRRAATKNNANGARKRIKTVAKRKNIRKRNQSSVVDDEPQGDSAALLNDFNNESPENMVASWKDGITGVGQEFQSVHEFRDALQKYAVAHRFMYRLKKNEKSRASGTCMVEGCPWRIYASWVPSEEVFRIKKMNVTHTCGGDSRRGATPTRNWLVSILKAKLRENPHCKPKEVADTILRDFGIELNYTQVWRGIGDAKQQLQGSYKEAYNLLPLFCDNLLEANPGSVAKLSIGDDKKFRNLFVCFDTSIYGFENGCRPLLFLDSTSLKSKHREILLTANALDGDDGVFPVAFAIIDIENGDNWLWFLEQLRSVLTTSQSITFVTDRQKELMNSVLKVFENAHHGYSIFHLLDDFMINLKGPFHGPGKNSLPANFLAAAQAARLDGFRMAMEKIKRVSPKAYEWLMEIEPDYWTNAAFKGESYHQISFDVAGSYANWIEEVGDLPLIRKLETIQCKVMELINKRHIDSAWWSTKLTPHKEEKLKEETHKARYLRVLFSSDTIFEVHNDSINVVDMDKQECSCLEWKATGLPCRHAIAVFNCTKRNAYDYCSQYFSVDSYRVAYSKSINPFAAVSAAKDNPAKGKTKPEDARVLPPGKSPLSSQQKRKRNRDGLIERTVTCTKCLGVGHNKVSCKATS